jgi:hypothetical protein
MNLYYDEDCDVMGDLLRGDLVREGWSLDEEGRWHPADCDCERCRRESRLTLRSGR